MAGAVEVLLTLALAAPSPRMAECMGAAQAIFKGIEPAAAEALCVTTLERNDLQDALVACQDFAIDPCPDPPKQTKLPWWTVPSIVGGVLAGVAVGFGLASL